MPGGLIPARAGKTSSASDNRTARGAHPRACGENPLSRTASAAEDGSSPRVRGKPPDIHNFYKDVRLIPARAGKTGPTSTRGPDSGAHPRACGENRCRRTGPGFSGGSSPRVRGKRSSASDNRTARGLIPARAGKTSLLFQSRDNRSAHPRACGENQKAAIEEQKGKGSSPRVRGKPSTPP